MRKNAISRQLESASGGSRLVDWDAEIKLDINLRTELNNQTVITVFDAEKAGSTVKLMVKDTVIQATKIR